MESRVKNKILLAVDGSDQALEAIRYACAMMPVEQTEFVLFYVGTGFPEVFWDMNGNPLYRTKKVGVMGWLATSQLVMGEFKEKAFKILADAGFGRDAVRVNTRAKRTGVVKDIIQETYQNYGAIVIGNTGMSRIKDLLAGSMAKRLANKVKHMPSVIVDGKPAPGRILIALDESIESMRGVSSVAALIGASNPTVTLCHCLYPKTIFRSYEKSQDIDAAEEDWQAYHESRFKPYMDEATQRLVDAGIAAENISREIVLTRGNIIEKIIGVALKGDFGTIVVGHREAAGFFEAHFRGRFSDRIIDSLENRAVWVVS
ncbi:MAG: universal stress protein [Deltaproteobacteria bacterium]|nr:universal stress protein [Deltaproteobacteria bacterium]